MNDNDVTRALWVIGYGFACFCTGLFVMWLYTP